MIRIVLILCIIFKLLSTNDSYINDSSKKPDDSKLFDSSYELLLKQFYEDTDMPDTIIGHFAEAMLGDADALDKFTDEARQIDSLKWLTYRIGINFERNLFVIGMLYYHGRDDGRTFQNRAKAFEWIKLSAEKRNADAALCAGDMSRYGDEVRVNEKAAFKFYSMAYDLDPLDYFINERLGDCYHEGIGVVADSQKAFEYYLESASAGHSNGLYKLSAFVSEADINLVALYKAASSQNYYGDYWAMAYGGLDSYFADKSKLELVNNLINIWNIGSDVAASNMKKSMKTNKYFPADFVEAFMQSVYTYSYHVFAEKYGLQTNRNHEDAKNIQIAPYDALKDKFGYYWEDSAERYLEYEDNKFYEYDFDGCGENEIGIPIHSGAGGAFMADGFGIFKKNKDGLYEPFAFGPDCSLRDAMRIIQYDGIIYFIVNWFDDPGYNPHDFIVYTIDENGNGLTLKINSKNYALQRIVSYTDEAYAVGYNGLLSEVEQQIRNAVAVTKQQRIYSPDDEEQLSYNIDENLWDAADWGYFTEVARHDVFFTANIYNNKIEQAIHKSRLIAQSRYYNDYYWFHIYENRKNFENGAVSVQKPVFSDEFYGLHSKGNLYDLLPIKNNIVQFWTYNHEGITYCVTMQRFGLLYSVTIFRMQNGKTILVNKSLYFDESQNVDISFS